jgi:hypothetical protein
MWDEIAGWLAEQGVSDRDISELRRELWVNRMDRAEAAGWRVERVGIDVFSAVRMRFAAVMRSSSGRPEASEVAAYLPFNYRIRGETADRVYIEGADNAGWTLDGYVIPRLGSGWITAIEVPVESAGEKG